MTKEELQPVLDAHAKWVCGIAGGVRANLYGANLAGANLYGANLAGSTILPEGVTFKQFMEDVLPALLAAGGKALTSFEEPWACHDWMNCPMAHAFDVHSISDVPLIWRPWASRFIQLYDAKLIPWDRVGSQVVIE